MSLTRGTSLLNSRDPERLLVSGGLGQLPDLAAVDAEVLPDLVAAEPVAHQAAALDHELLALGSLLVAQLPVVVAQRHPSERHVPGREPDPPSWRRDRW
jgi:hypothetical protein